MRKIILAAALLTSVSAHASGKSIHQVCTDYADYLGHAYNFAVSDKEADRQVLLRDIDQLKLSVDSVEWEVARLRHDEKRRFMLGMFSMHNDAVSRGQYESFIQSCEQAPAVTIPSWPALVSSGVVDRKAADDAGYMPKGLENAPGMRHQQPARKDPSNPCHNTLRDNIPQATLEADEKAGRLPDIYKETTCEPKKSDDLNGAQKALKSLNLPFKLY